MKRWNWLKRIIALSALLLVAVLATGFGVNVYMIESTRADIRYSAKAYGGTLPAAEQAELSGFNADCILVLGCGIKDDETPTDMLRDRLDTGIMLYQSGVAPKILLTGDNGTNQHNEIHVMLNYCLDRGVPPEDVFCDHAGFSTRESMVRARDIFGVRTALVVTQTYHEYRALYLGRELGLTVYGTASDQEEYLGQLVREVREVLARDKAFFQIKTGNDRAVGGEPIPITGDGRVSHGE